MSRGLHAVRRITSAARRAVGLAAVALGCFASTALAAEADAPTPAADSHAFLVGLGVDALEPASIRGIVRLRFALPKRWRLGTTFGTRGPGMTGTLDVDHQVWARGEHALDVGARVGGSMRTGALEPWLEEAGYARSPWPTDYYAYKITADMLAGGTVGYRGKLGRNGLLALDLTVLGVAAASNPEVSYREAPLGIFFDVTVGPVWHPQRVPALVREARALTPAEKEHRLRKNGMILTVSGLAVLATSGVLAAAITGGYGARYIPLMAGGSIGTVLISSGAPMWAIGNKRVRQRREAREAAEFDPDPLDE